MLKLAVTGGIACGKSTVGECLRDLGASVCDADDLAHKLMIPGENVFTEVVKFFGVDVVGRDGEIDRRRLGARVFSNSNELAVLNGIKKAWVRWLECKIGEGVRVAVVIVPLLYEVREDAGWDDVVCVWLTEKTQIERLSERGLSLDDIKARISAQMPLAEKAKLADYVIMNTGTRDLLKQQVKMVFRNIMKKDKQ
jgi:dephospho-CoA kinase